MSYEISNEQKALLLDKKAEYEKIKQEKEKLEAEVETLEERISCLEDELSEKEKDTNTLSLLYKGFDINEDNSTCVRLHDSIRTTPIIDSFYFSDKDFLIFERQFSSMNVYSVYFSLVVVKNQYNIHSRGTSLTMTDLKKHTRTSIGSYSVSEIMQKSRLYPLYDEIFKISKQELKDETYIPFETPCVLKGQTYSDQTGYGKEYNGDSLVYEKNYGDASRFLIIGVIVDRIY